MAIFGRAELDTGRAGEAEAADATKKRQRVRFNGGLIGGVSGYFYVRLRRERTHGLVLVALVCRRDDLHRPERAGSREAARKPPPKTKKKAKRKRYARPAATGTYAYESAPVSVRARKRKAGKKR